MPRHLALPIAVTPSGVLSSLEQDSEAEVAQSVGLLVATVIGDRRAATGYGIPDPLGRGLDPATLADVLETWEPRADPSTVLVEPTNADGTQAADIYLP
ncbi:GPW/gp25 family protein [Nocardioides sp. TRM66260-LWL]|uniref:GPW/gp25 family protein n=1 Tax=Nocardioides sp. TRM66260-LWL TaxID=2874478 RepID=UPI001CC512C5|nr:GPW/gp25 family protein [Nocardioides sp. TRM66260-LWL]MBZ5736503.1 GPW/gp25 family protein [Nocardioides sp. TRM66260-LWL]